MPQVSVIIPVFNAEKYVAETIESVLSQKLSDFELLLINDGSTDGSADALEELLDGCGMKARSKVLHHA